MLDTSSLPILVSKALVDTGYDLISPTGDGWFRARISGSPAEVWVYPRTEATLLAIPEPRMAERIGLAPVEHVPPTAMGSIGQVQSAAQLYQSLHLLRSLLMHPAAALSAELEARLATIAETERTREVRQRIGQDVFREALIELWQGRCALSCVALPSALLRASHAKPWAMANDMERLDPFNGLLLAVQYDALFDQGLIAFNGDGTLLVAPSVSPEARTLMRLNERQKLRSVLPGHKEYLDFHRRIVARLP